MMQSDAFVEQIQSMKGRLSECADVFAERLRTLNQSYIQSAVLAIREENQEELNNLLKSYKKLRKTLSALSKNGNEKFFYEAGAFIGTYRVFLELYDAAADQEYNRERKKLLDHKHVKELMMYLYRAPYSRQKNIAEGIDIRPNYLSEILNKLMQAGYVERYGRSKGTQYCLTKSGRQVCRMTFSPNKVENVVIEAEYKEIQDKEKFLKGWSERTIKEKLGKEDGYAKWKTDYRSNSSAWSD